MVYLCAGTYDVVRQALKAETSTEAEDSVADDFLYGDDMAGKTCL